MGHAARDEGSGFWSSFRNSGLAIGAGVLTLLACAGPLWFWGAEPPTFTKLESVTSPDGDYVATVFKESGGGAAGYLLHNVTVHRAGAPFDPTARLLVDGGYRGVSARWLGPKRLEVRWAQEAQATERRHAVGDVRIVYPQVATK